MPVISSMMKRAPANLADWYLISVARERTISIRSMNESLANPESLGGACPDKIATFAAEEKAIT